MSGKPVQAGEEGLTGRLRSALTQALSARDMIAAAALRSALAAIGNAEAVPLAPDRATPASSQHFAGARARLVAGEAARRELRAGETEQLVRDEINARLAAAREYDELGRGDRADRLRREAAVLTSVIGSPP